MRFLTDDGLFGFIVTPLTGSGMYRFQLVIHGELVGDIEPCFLESAMRSLGRLQELADSRLRRVSVDVASVMGILESDDLLHDAALLQVAESLDGWKVRGYVYEGNATFLATSYMPGSDRIENPIMFAVVPLAEYDSIFGAAHDYWVKTRRGK
jgi:hypothetical protein